MGFGNNEGAPNVARASGGLILDLSQKHNNVTALQKNRSLKTNQNSIILRPILPQSTGGQAAYTQNGNVSVNRSVT